MQRKILFGTLISFLALNCCLGASVNLFGVYIRWTNLENKTDFYVTSSLGKGVDPKNAWLSIGINDVPKMVWVYSNNF